MRVCVCAHHIPENKFFKEIGINDGTYHFKIIIKQKINKQNPTSTNTSSRIQRMFCSN